MAGCTIVTTRVCYLSYKDVYDCHFACSFFVKSSLNIAYRSSGRLLDVDQLTINY